MSMTDTIGYTPDDAASFRMQSGQEAARPKIQTNVRPIGGLQVLTQVQRMVEKGLPYRIEKKPTPHVVFDAYEYNRRIWQDPNALQGVRNGALENLKIMSSTKRRKDPYDF